MKKNASLSNLLPFFTTVFILLSIMTVQAQENKICTVEVREYPGRDPVMWNGLYAASDGKYIRV